MRHGDAHPGPRRESQSVFLPRITISLQREPRSGGRALNQERVPELCVPVTSQWCAQEAADQAARVRVHDGLLVANISTRTIIKV